MPSLNYYQQEYDHNDKERQKRIKKYGRSSRDYDNGIEKVKGSEQFLKTKFPKERNGKSGGIDPELLGRRLEGRKSRHKTKKTRESHSKYIFDTSDSDSRSRDRLTGERRRSTRVNGNNDDVFRREEKRKERKKEGSSKSKDRKSKRSIDYSDKSRYRAKDSSLPYMESTDDQTDDSILQNKRRENLRRIQRGYEVYKSDDDLLTDDRKSKQYSNDDDKSAKSRTLPRKKREKQGYHLEKLNDVESTNIIPRELKRDQGTYSSYHRDTHTKRLDKPSKSTKELIKEMEARYKAEAPPKTKTHRRTKSRENILVDSSTNINNNNNSKSISTTLPRAKKSTLYVKPITKEYEKVDKAVPSVYDNITKNDEIFISNFQNGYSENVYRNVEIAKKRTSRYRSIADDIEDEYNMKMNTKSTKKSLVATHSLDNLLSQDDVINNNSNFGEAYNSTITDSDVMRQPKHKEKVIYLTRKTPEIPRLQSQESTTSTSSNMSQKLLSLKETKKYLQDDDQTDSSKKSGNSIIVNRLAWKRNGKDQSSDHTMSENESDARAISKPVISAPYDFRKNGIEIKETESPKSDRKKEEESPQVEKRRHRKVKEVMSEPESSRKAAKQKHKMSTSPFTRRKKQKDVSKLTTLQYRPSDLGYPKHTESKPVMDDNVSVESRSSNNTSTSTDLSRMSSQSVALPVNGQTIKTKSDKDKKKNSEVVFTVNLDENLPQKNSNSVKSKAMFFMGGNKSRSPSTSSLSQNNKWNQTEGPPIRAPPSETIAVQTTINPVMYKTSKTQVQPWNFDGLMYHCGSQTERKMCNAETQTNPEPTHCEMSTQCEVKQFANGDTQTANPTMCDTGMEAIATMTTMETQTEEEGSKIWGSAVSLDRLVRSRAKHRSRSLNKNDGTDSRGHSRSNSVGRLSSTGDDIENESVSEETKSGKITSYSWSQTNKFVKIFVSYSGVHLIPTNLIAVKTNGINLSLSVKEPLSETTENGEVLIDKSSLKLHRLTRPVAALSYTVQRDMLTIMLRKQKALEWDSLLYGKSQKMPMTKSESNLLR